MNFLQQLDEAANIPLDALKERMKKDPRVKMLFQRTLNVDEIKNPDEFIRTLRFYLFSNPHVREYLKKRADAHTISKTFWDNLNARLVPGNELSPVVIDWLRDSVKQLFKDVGLVQQRKLSSETIDAFHSWYERPYFQLHRYTVRQIESLELKPSKPIVLYRGLLFDERSFRESDGVINNGSALSFLKSIREGTRIVDLTFDSHTLWQKDKNAAIKMALLGSNESWRNIDDVERKIQKHRGILAYVISTLATPDDILVDIGEAKEQLHFADSSPALNQVVLHPGKLTCRMVHKFTPEGEQDPTATRAPDQKSLEDIRSQLSLLGRILKLPFPDITFRGINIGGASAAMVAQVGTLIQPEVHEVVLKLMRQVISLYNKHLANIDPKALAADAGKDSRTYNALTRIHELFNRTISHRNYAETDPSKVVTRRQRIAGSVSFKDIVDVSELLTAEPTFDNSNAAQAARHIVSRKRWTDWQITGAFTGFARIVDPTFKTADKLHLAGWKEQEKLVDKAMDGFYQVIGKPKPESHEQQAKDFVRVLNTANVAAVSVDFLQQLRDIAKSVDE